MTTIELFRHLKEPGYVIPAVEVIVCRHANLVVVNPEHLTIIQT